MDYSKYINDTLNRQIVDPHHIVKTTDAVDFSLEDITRAVKEFMIKNDNDETVVPDITIYETSHTFMVTINTDDLKVNTGIGGFKLFLSHISSLDFLKVEYNGVILNLEQKQELFNKIKK